MSQIHIRTIRGKKTDGKKTDKLDKVLAGFWVDIAKALMGRARYLEALEMLQAAYEALPNPAVSELQRWNRDFHLIESWPFISHLLTYKIRR
jgi:hypothetical protein